MISYSETTEVSLTWFRLSYVILLPAPLLTQWICFQLIREPMPKYAIVGSGVVTTGLAVATFFTPYVIPSVEIHPFIPQFGPLYSGLSVLAVFHIANGYILAKLNLRRTIIFNREIDFANRFMGHLMIPLTLGAMVGGVGLPWMVERRIIRADFPFFVIGLVIIAAYYVLANYIFWRLEAGGHDEWAQRLLQSLSSQLRRFLLTRQALFRESLREWIGQIKDGDDIEHILKQFSQKISCGMLLEWTEGQVRNYGEASELLPLQLSKAEWDRRSYLVASRLAQENPGLFEQLVAYKVGAVFPVIGRDGQCIGQLKFGMAFSHRFFHSQDFAVIETFCERLARQHLLPLKEDETQPLLVKRDDVSFSWLRWAKTNALPIFGKTIHIYGSGEWSRKIEALLSHHFLCRLSDRKSKLASIVEEKDTFVILEDIDLAQLPPLPPWFDFKWAMLPIDLDETETVEFCVRSLLIQAGMIHGCAQWDGCILSFSPAIGELVNDLDRIAKRADPPPIFLSGPTGVGKNLFVSYFHQKSARTGKLVSINCAAIPEHLLESELFGYRKGAFTGATHDKKGLFEEAQGGILFLDEIGDMPPPLQAKLLHVLQERKVQPIGSTVKVPLDVWVISASKYSISEMKTRVRDDLFFRLMGISRVVPCLQNRSLDIPLLVAFILHCDSQFTQAHWRCTELWMKEKLEWAWPGNVRELVQRVRSEMALTEKSYRLDLDVARKAAHDVQSSELLGNMPQLGQALARPTLLSEQLLQKSYKDFKRVILQNHSRAYFENLLKDTTSQQEVAKRAGISPSRLSVLLKELGMHEET